MKALILLLTLLSSVHHSLLVNAAEAPDEIVARGNKDLDRPVPYKDLLSEQEGEDTFSSNTTSTSWTPGLPDGRPEPTEEQHHDENLDFIAISRNSYPNWRWTNREMTLPQSHTTSAKANTTKNMDLINPNTTKSLMHSLISLVKQTRLFSSDGGQVQMTVTFFSKNHLVAALHGLVNRVDIKIFGLHHGVLKEGLSNMKHYMH